jgi:lipoprotein-releasing system permease protein
MAAIARLPGVRSVSPTVAGSAFAVRGLASRSVALLGIQPELHRRVFRVADAIVQGRYRASGDDLMIGVELADDLGVSAGDKVRIVTASGRGQVFTVRGVFDLGNRDVNQRWAIVSMRAAQTLLDLVGGVSNIDVTVDEIFDADAIAAEIESRTGLSAESWMKTNAQLLIGLQSQSSSSTMIQIFVVLAVAMGIASVLVVSVVQKSREIGILRAMGTSRRTISAVFLLEGAAVGLVGSIVGIGIGVVLALFFAQLARLPDGSPRFPVDLNAFLFLRTAVIATLTGLVSAVAPARRAARLDPAVEIGRAHV